MASIVASGLSLTLPVYTQRDEVPGAWVKAILGAALRRPQRHFRTILEGVDLTVGDGDRLAILGRNGAGKSTLLRILAGAYWPTAGSLLVEGQRQALMNLSLGFNPEATLLENIYLRSTAMGMRVAQIQPHIGEILEFAGLTAKAADRLKTLSSGQRMRLGFSISTAIQPDIMLLDEWIGTGDAEFLRKAKERLRDRIDRSRILVVASHNLKLVRRLCNRALLLEDGRPVFDGEPNQAIVRYRSLLEAGRRQEPRLANARA